MIVHHYRDVPTTVPPPGGTKRIVDGQNQFKITRGTGTLRFVCMIPAGMA